MIWRTLYTILWYLITPFVALRLLWRSRRAPLYRKRWAERFGFFPTPDPKWQNGIWVHTVSVGEFIAAIPLIKLMMQDYPHLPITITTMTPTGSERVKATFGDKIFHVYLPYDIPRPVNRFLNAMKPKISVVMETELWPNLFYSCRERNMPVIIANARLSAKSAQGYARFSTITTQVLHNITHVAAQAPDDAKRFVALGLSPEKLIVTGSIKFDITPAPDLKEKARALRQQWGEHRLVWIAASTHEGEDEPVLSAYAQLKQQFPELVLVLVPRHPERFNSVAERCKATGFSVARRSHGVIDDKSIDIYVGDTMGELMLLYASADVAFVAGSLRDIGGHNILEPAALGVPVVVGPHMFNFAQITDLLKDAQGLIQIDDGAQLAQALQPLLQDETHRRAIAANASVVVEQNRGALNTLWQLIKTEIS